MSKLSKFLYLIAILLLGWLAVAPHWPKIKEEAVNFYAAWQQIRSSEGGAVEKVRTVEAEEENIRVRAIATPKPPEELPAPASKQSASGAIDPFLSEARERAEKDPEAAMQWLQEQSTGAERLRGMLEVVALWAAKDSESALLWLESNAQGIARLETLNSGVEMWAERDPQAAASWIDGMASDQSKIAAAKSLASTWGRSEADAASTWVESLPAGPIREEAASALALAWMESDPQRSALWTSWEASRSGNAEILHQVIDKYVQLAPAEAEQFVRKLPVDPFDDPNTYSEFIGAFVQARAKQDPEETADWLQSLQDGDRLKQTGNVKNLLQVWTETDSIAASAWLSEQALGPERDAAIAGFSETIRRFEPEAAAAWADAISDPEKRIQELSKSVQTWAQTKPDAALNWIVTSELEPALQEQLAREIGFE